MISIYPRRFLFLSERIPFLSFFLYPPTDPAGDVSIAAFAALLVSGYGRGGGGVVKIFKKSLTPSLLAEVALYNNS